MNIKTEVNKIEKFLGKNKKDNETKYAVGFPRRAEGDFFNYVIEERRNDKLVRTIDPQSKEGRELMRANKVELPRIKLNL